MATDTVLFAVLRFPDVFVYTDLTPERLITLISIIDLLIIISVMLGTATVSYVMLFMYDDDSFHGSVDVLWLLQLLIFHFIYVSCI